MRSFLHRFDDWYVQLVHRKNNTAAHEQANGGCFASRNTRYCGRATRVRNVGLQMAREIKSGTL